ncbi:hypothetical protein SLEP1_g13877 [Rubroshorea leprosula]|uniref:Uncharacterized protein n=1 Tax=Rubroshorea leprosula TaxID=152421 RepID=A0AAV5IRD4_9ROSI|nr:hypothetical protein SLEP1_g13877 [Rubroshorea leprosula]
MFSFPTTRLFTTHSQGVACGFSGNKPVIAPNPKSFFNPQLHFGMTCKAPRWNSGGVFIGFTEEPTWHAKQDNRNLTCPPRRYFRDREFESPRLGTSDLSLQNHNAASSSFPLHRSRSAIRCLCLSSLLDLEKSAVDTCRINHCLCLSSTDEMLVRGRVSGVPPRISQIDVNDGLGDGRCLMPMDYCQCDETQIWV